MRAAAKTVPMSEGQLQSAVVELAQRFGWLAAHFRTARTSKGDWLTPVTADAAGYPDLTLARRGQVIFAELKSDRGALSQSQRRWIGELGGVVWTPREWRDGTIEKALR